MDLHLVNAVDLCWIIMFSLGGETQNITVDVAEKGLNRVIAPDHDILRGVPDDKVQKMLTHRIIRCKGKLNVI